MLAKKLLFVSQNPCDMCAAPILWYFQLKRPWYFHELLSIACIPNLLHRIQQEPKLKTRFCYHLSFKHACLSKYRKVGIRLIARILKEVVHSRFVEHISGFASLCCHASSLN